MERAHSPQDEIYGPITLPSYCWAIIDTPEFQRLRHIYQLGPTHYVFPDATHTRFDHSLGTAYLSTVFMNNIKMSQSDLNVQEDHCKAVIIAGLCHDLGHGPWSHCFEPVAKEIDSTWTHEDMSCIILMQIYERYNIRKYVSEDVINAACCYIRGESYDKYPLWLSSIISNKETDIDLDKLDYLARDVNRTLNMSKLQFTRLILNCKVIDNKLAWKHSDIHLIQGLFYRRNDMHKRVYQHRVCNAISLMLVDMLFAAESYFNFESALYNVDEYIKLDDRIFSIILNGKCGEEAQKIAEDINCRRLYKCVGELRFRPDLQSEVTYSQLPRQQIEKNISDIDSNLPVNKLRVVKINYRYGISKNGKNPLELIPFWKSKQNKEDDKSSSPVHETYYLTGDDISCIGPIHFYETSMRVFVTDPKFNNIATAAFEKWRSVNGFK